MGLCNDEQLELDLTLKVRALRVCIGYVVCEARGSSSEDVIDVVDMEKGGREKERERGNLDLTCNDIHGVCELRCDADPG